MFSLDVEWGVRIRFAGLKYWIGTRDYWNGRSRDSLRLCIFVTQSHDLNCALVSCSQTLAGRVWLCIYARLTVHVLDQEFITVRVCNCHRVSTTSIAISAVWRR